MGKKVVDNEDLRCSVCGKLASKDSHFYKTKMLCNRHYIQMYRHGEILDDNCKHPTILKHKCDICGDETSYQHRIWYSDDEYNGLELCGKHYAQIRKYNKFLDKMPSCKNKERICSVCGSRDDVIYSRMYKDMYCRRHYSQLYDLGGLMEITRFDKNKYDIKDDGVHIYLRNCKHEIIAETIIDECDLERVIQHKWSLGSWGYASAVIDGNNVLLQRFILQEYDKDRIPDHINRDTLDNRRENLRIVDKSMNAVNADIRSNNTSGVTGVSWSNSLSLWRSYINYRGKRIELGYFKDKIEAIKSRLNAENKYYPGAQPQKYMFEEYGITSQNDYEGKE